MSEGYLSVLINRQIPDSIWLEKSEKPLSGTEQDPFVVAFEQHFADSDVAHTFIVRKLIESGAETWAGGQFRGTTTREVIALLWKTSTIESPGQPSHTNPSLADLAAYTKPVAHAHSGKYGPAGYVLVGGIAAILLLVVFIVARVGDISPNQSGSPDQSSASIDMSHANAASPSPIAISNVRTYWLYGDPTEEHSAMCTPAIAFRVQNRSTKDFKNLFLSGSFKEPTARSTYGDGLTLLADLPAGYAHDVAVTSANGSVIAPGTCSPENLPKLWVSVAASALGLDEMPLIPEKLVNNRATALYTNTLSRTEAPTNLSDTSSSNQGNQRTLTTEELNKLMNEGPGEQISEEDFKKMMQQNNQRNTPHDEGNSGQIQVP